MESIYSTIRKELNDFYNNQITVVPGYTINQNELLKRIHLYLNSKYEDSSTYLGRDKIFFNIVMPPVEVATRMLNVDTKNIKLLPLNPKSEFSTYLLEKELKTWLKKNKLGKVLNQIAEEAPRYGSVVLEKTKDGAQVVDLRRLVLDTTVENIQKSRFVTTIHYMTPTELRETGWDNVDVAIERFGNKDAQEPFQDQQGNISAVTSTPYIKVIKRYGEVPKWMIDGGKSEEMVKALFIVAGAEDESHNESGESTGDLGVTLFKSRWHKEWPYKDFHYTKIRGRWLGQGVVEMLFDVQVRVNELKNQKRISMEISSMHLFQGPKSMVRNILTDLQSGDYLPKGTNDPDGITPIANEERNLPAFDGEEASYLGQADRLSFAYEAIRGQDSSSQQTLGQTQIQTAQATSVYAFKKENLALFLQDFFNELVMPNLMKDLTAEHIMRFTGSLQELQKLDEAASEVHATDYVKNKILDGSPVYAEDFDALKKKAMDTYKKGGDSRFLKMKDAFYDDVEFEFDFNINNEQVDPLSIARNAQTVFSAAAQIGPAMGDPMVKLAFMKFAENLGVPKGELELADGQRTQMMNSPQGQQQLGMPSPMPMPLPAQSQA